MCIYTVNSIIDIVYYLSYNKIKRKGDDMNYKEVFLSQDLLDSDISLEGIVLLAHIITQINLKIQSFKYGYIDEEQKDELGYYVILSNQELKDLLRIKSNATLSKVKKELIDKGLIKQKRVIDSSNKYYIVEE